MVTRCQVRGHQNQDWMTGCRIVTLSAWMLLWSWCTLTLTSIITLVPSHWRVCQSLTLPSVTNNINEMETSQLQRLKTIFKGRLSQSLLLFLWVFKRINQHQSRNNKNLTYFTCLLVFRADFILLDRLITIFVCFEAARNKFPSKSVLQALEHGFGTSNFQIFKSKLKSCF